VKFNLKNNSVKEMVDVLTRIGPMEENDINKAAFGFDRNNTYASNKKYADMLRRGVKKGIIGRMEYPENAVKNSRAQFIYFATKETKVPCSLKQDMEWAYESDNLI
tara:strand:+ start:896 stop:1213 length:318 start_codon:yes stop_codon:yes gene_type:complete